MRRPPFIDNPKELAAMSWVSEYLDFLNWDTLFPHQFARFGAVHDVDETLKPRRLSAMHAARGCAVIERVEPFSRRFATLCYVPQQVADSIPVLGEC
jgi:hypothetical protein